MVADPVVVASRRIVVLALLASILMLPLAASPGHADDIPEGAQESMAKAREYLDSGEKRNFRKAWNRIKKLRDECKHSVDYWDFYLQLGQAMGKDEAKLWAEIGQVEKTSPGCPSFELLRARRTNDMLKRQKHLEKAVQIAPEDMRPKLVLVDHLLAIDEEIDAEEIVDAILEKTPDHVGALVRKGRVQMSGEYFNAAIEFADEVLARKPLPEMHNLKAQAYLAMRESEGKDTLEDAHKAASEAVKLRADAGFVVTLARVLELQDKLAEARDLVTKHHEAAPSPLLSALLGDYAFRTGDYKKAAAVFKRTAATSELSARAYATALFRLGEYKDAAQALESVLARSTESGRRMAANLYAIMGRFDQAEAALAGLEGEDADWSRMYVACLAGKPEAFAAKAKEMAEEDSLVAEWHLMYYAEALVVKAMGEKSQDALRELMRKARAQVGAAKVPTAEPPEKAYELEAKTAGYMRRVPAYYTSICGNVFAPGNLERGGDASQDDAGNVKLKLFMRIPGIDTKCRRDRVREWRFNPIEVAQGASIQLPGTEDWGPVKEDFLEGCAKLVGGEHGAAVGAFDKALVGEPGWHRVKLLRSVALALSDPAQRKTAAEDALAAVEDWPGDHLGRELAIRLAHWAGQDVSKAATSYLTHAEAHADRDLNAL